VDYWRTKHDALQVVLAEAQRERLRGDALSRPPSRPLSRRLRDYGHPANGVLVSVPTSLLREAAFELDEREKDRRSKP
jgi:hypothetical protein